jgi:hypothetical protein
LEKEDGDDNTLDPPEPSGTSGHKGKGKAAKEKEAGEASKEPTKGKDTTKGKSATKGKAVAATVRAKKVKQASPPDAPKAASGLVTTPGPAVTTARAAAPTVREEGGAKVRQLSQTDTSTLLVTFPKKDGFQFPPKPTSLGELPSTIAELEHLLPKIQVHLAVDSVEEDDEDAILLLALAAVPDMPRYLEKNLELLKTHRGAITTDDGDEALAQLKQREQVLRWYLAQYRLLAPGAEAEAETEMLVDPIFGADYEMNVDLEPFTIRELWCSKAAYTVRLIICCTRSARCGQRLELLISSIKCSPIALTHAFRE